MSRLNLQNDLFLGLQELQRQDKFIKEDGYIRIFKSLINNFGIVEVVSDTSFDNFKVQNGTNSGTIKISTDSYAIDNSINILFKESFDNLVVVDDNSWYWVKVSYLESTLETGFINLAANGNITGVGTKFSETLRDQNSYPVKISFPNSSLNTGDYQVVSVLSDTQAILSGSAGFTDENNLDFEVVGSFTPGISYFWADRLPYIYDSCQLEFIAELSVNVPPAKTDGEEFYIARVKNNGGSVTIQDKRTELLTMAKKNSGWIQPTLGVAFTNTSGREVMYRKNYLGEVELKGSFTTVTGTATLFTLPEGFCPPYTIQGIYGYSDGSVVRIITIDSAGVVKGATAFPFHTSNINEIITLKFNPV